MRITTFEWVRAVICCGVMVVIGGGRLPAQAGATGAAAAKPAEIINALLVSDIHFDPFHDPAKAQRLMDAQEGEWNGILAGEASADQAESFAKLQKACGANGMDTPYALLQSSLAAMKKESAGSDAKFALVSGDLVVHRFDCRFKALLPGKADADYEAFVAKTVRYVVGQMRLALTGAQGTKVPVYVALGNNDSGCGDYEMDSGDGFLEATKELMVDGLPSVAEKKAALESYAKSGDYSVMMQGAMRRTRLIVLDDLFQSRRYTGCGRKPNTAGADAQIAWLTKELAAARQRHERVWVMGHIPPGVDPYSTFSKFTDVCKGGRPVTFLSSERLANVLGEYADVVRLGVFGHTHMDEMRLFGKEGPGSSGKVAIKMVAAISPIYGNDPSFTVARVDPATARLVDYAVIVASNKTGIDAVWKKEYAYGETYHEAVFSPAALDKLIAAFGADPDARSDMSRAYLSNYIAGDKSLLMKSLWPQYVCAQENQTEKGFAACVCPTAK